MKVFPNLALPLTCDKESVLTPCLVLAAGVMPNAISTWKDSTFERKKIRKWN